MKKLMIVLTMSALILLVGCGKSSGIYNAGTYTAAGEGYGGDVMVETVFGTDAILSVTVISQNETAGIGDKAIKKLPIKILEEQTNEVDVIASATVTSEAIKSAVKECMEQAKN